MVVAATDLHLLKSASGSSDGGAQSAVEITSNVMNNLFQNFSDAERLAGATRDKAFFLSNQHGSDALLSPSYWMSTTPTGETATLAVHKDDSGATDPDMGTLSAFGATAVVSLISDGADTRTVRIIGLDGSGDPLEEDVVLTGAVEKLSVGSYSVLYAIHTTSSGSRIITVKQGAAGTTRGTLGTGKVEAWLWITAVSKGSGIHRADLPAGAEHGFWLRFVLPPASSGIRPNHGTFALEENS